MASPAGQSAARGSEVVPEQLRLGLIDRALRGAWFLPWRTSLGFDPLTLAPDAWVGVEQRMPERRPRTPLYTAQFGENIHFALVRRGETWLRKYGPNLVTEPEPALRVLITSKWDLAKGTWS